MLYMLVNIEGPCWYHIYHHLPVAKGVNKPLLINQPMRKGHLWIERNAAQVRVPIWCQNKG